MALSAETNQRVAFNNYGVWLQQAVNGVEEAQRKGALIVSVISGAENEKRQCGCRSPENSYLQKKRARQNEQLVQEKECRWTLFAMRAQQRDGYEAVRRGAVVPGVASAVLNHAIPCF
jgi:hypothetical protein